jgi:hypothetical protein
MNLDRLITVGSVWKDWEGDRAVVISIDLGSDYPVLYRWDNQQFGRDTVKGFLTEHSPVQGWANLLENLP